MKPAQAIGAGCPATWAYGSRAAGWLPGERVRGGEPAAELFELMAPWARAVVAGAGRIAP